MSTFVSLLGTSRSNPGNVELGLSPKSSNPTNPTAGQNVPKIGKVVPAEGMALFWGNQSLVNGGLTAMIIPPGGNSGQAGATLTDNWMDVYGVAISSSDPAPNTITLSDGTSSISWIIGTSPIMDDVKIPYRFAKGAALTVSSSAVASTKAIQVSLRGICSKT
jgi:hypothetical protein